MSSEERSLWLMVTGRLEDPIPVRIIRESFSGEALEGILAFTQEDGSVVEVECIEDKSMRAVEVDPVQFCHKMAGLFVEDGIDVVFIDKEPHPLNYAGARHALETTGDMTWHTLVKDRDVIRESIRRLRHTMTYQPTEDDDEPFFGIDWAGGLKTAHPQIVQDQLEAGHNVYARNDLPWRDPHVADFLLPLSTKGNTAPLLCETPCARLRMFVSNPEWLGQIIARMEFLGRPKAQFWVVSIGDGSIELLGPAG
jgi:hypothetical protein